MARRPPHPISSNYATIAKRFRIRTRRLELRLVEARDYPALRDGYQNMRSPKSRFDDEPALKKRANASEFKKLLTRQKKGALLDRHYALHVFHRRTGEHLGGVDIFVYMRGAMQWANVGYSIHNQHWGHGYAPEAVRAAIELAFRVLKLHRVEASTELDNHPSRKTALRAGMKQECIRRSFMYDRKRKKWLDYVVYVKIGGPKRLSSGTSGSKRRPGSGPSLRGRVRSR